MILPGAVAAALILTTLAGHVAVHYQRTAQVEAFVADLDAHRGTWHGPVSHRRTAPPGSAADQTIHTTTQPIPAELRRQATRSRP